METPAADHTRALSRAVLTNQSIVADGALSRKRSSPKVHLKVLMAHEVDQLDLVQLTWQPFMGKSVLLQMHHLYYHKAAGGLISDSIESMGNVTGYLRAACVARYQQ